MKKNIRILHCPSDVGGRAWMISRAERELGYQSDNMILKSSRFEFPFDFNLHFEKGNFFINFWKSFVFLLKSIKRYDIFHFYCARSILPFGLDLPLLKIFRKKIFFTFQGCEIRRKGYFTKHFKINICCECQEPRCCKKRWEIIKLLRLKTFLLLSDKTFVSTPDLIFYSSSSELIPQPNVDLKEWRLDYEGGEKKLITILHAPTSEDRKGTEYIVGAVSELEREGYPLRFKLIRGVKHNQMKELCRDADIVVDQLLAGWYGGFAVEMMALGKPVVCYLNEDFFRFVPWIKEIPIINASIDNLYEKLKWLIENPEERKRLGRLSREYVEKYHDPIKIAKKLIKYYVKEKNN